ncbi:helix-turn-helix domain-containing protein [Gordonia sp. w5E2]|uniref:sigma-54-dependent Fis family transcriptional regulator n=1 Tax=Gordonia TaxID=2053 RepID=UPI0007E9B0CF|nr:MULTISPECIES: helix-turn-helix domain-containing protein [unclassified Gordonia (in: high G+C Gram-positive bacteria)]OBC03970.1 Fis family transcriptional regulator [Gordonia sp. 852002-50816_SCH5313054-a]OBC14407.1 Fis family transcriptional regulator [Gordonia sp. 852002-50816_SCH5313054-c]
MISQPPAQAPTSRHVARARERFLSDDDVDVDVRDAIFTSWRRSRALNVDADRLELPFVREPNPETPLIAAARPVLDQLANDLVSEPISIILTSPDGVVLSRATANRGLQQMLDDVSLAPGYSYSEEHAGTNGIGTALETRQPTLVSGSEHYAGCLGRLSCAGVPILNPISGAIVGALDLTCLTEQEHPSSLLLSLAKSATSQIVQRMVSQASERESRLLNAYLATCRRAPQAMVIGLSGDVVLMNRRLRHSMNPSDQTALLELAVDHSVDAHSLDAAIPRVSALPSGRVARLSPVDEHCDSDIAVFRVHLVDGSPTRHARVTRTSATALPGLVGRSSSWRQCCDNVAGHVRAGRWIAVSGESGSGRTAVLRAAAERFLPGTTRVFNADDFESPETFDALEAELDTDGFGVIIRGLDQLDDDTVNAISDLLPGREHAGWLAVTTLPDAGNAASVLLPFFGHTVELPPLRHRIEDLHDLVPTLLKQLTRGRELAVAPNAMNQLSKYSWPGNVTELRQILREVVTHQRTGTIEAAQLPPRCRSTSRHTLTRIESLERDAIVRSLEENNHSKAAAAAALGISRATIYRKIREFGINT